MGVRQPLWQSVEPGERPGEQPGSCLSSRCSYCRVAAKTHSARKIPPDPPSEPRSRASSCNCYCAAPRRAAPSLSRSLARSLIPSAPVYLPRIFLIPSGPRALSYLGPTAPFSLLPLSILTFSSPPPSQSARNSTVCHSLSDAASILSLLPVIRFCNP